MKERIKEMWDYFWYQLEAHFCASEEQEEEPRDAFEVVDGATRIGLGRRK